LLASGFICERFQKVFIIVSGLKFCSIRQFELLTAFKEFLIKMKSRISRMKYGFLVLLAGMSQVVKDIKRITGLASEIIKIRKRFVVL
jgi:hypothetical protein